MTSVHTLIVIGNVPFTTDREAHLMDLLRPAPPRSDIPATLDLPDASSVRIPQYSPRAILAIWAGAALPMAVLAWIIAPRFASSLGGTQPFTRALILLLTAGLIWQFVLVVTLVGLEQRSLRWSTVREALWLRSPRSPRTGRTGGRLWLILIPLVVAFGAEAVLPSLSHPASRDLGVFMASDAGQTFFSGAWGWFGVALVLVVFNTVLGEELLFRGFLLPRMNGAFGRADWVVNGVLFAAYHLHTPWVIPATLLDALILSYPTKRYRSAWIGIVVHSVQSVVIMIALLVLVLR
ncbi:MAG: CPBP family intramembrane glutamic endopeptidase [Actinomycetota bacterium]